MPASLQAYSGKGKSANKTYYRIQPYLPCGKRVTIRLGSNTKQWLEEVATEPVCKTLVGHGIISELPLQFQVDERFTTISMLADEYIRTRCAGLDEETVVIYNKARKNLLREQSSN